MSDDEDQPPPRIITTRRRGAPPESSRPEARPSRGPAIFFCALATLALSPQTGPQAVQGEALASEAAWLAVLILLSAYFSGMEIALFSLGKAHLRALMEKGVHGAKVVARLKANPERLLVIILIGNNVVNIGAASLATAVAIRMLGNVGVGIATGVMTFLILVFGEIVPKSLALKWAERISLLGARPLELFGRILFPAVWLLEKTTRALINLGRKESKSGVEHKSLLLTLARLGLESGSIDEHEHRAVASALRLDRVPADRVMTPRKEIVGVEAETRLEDAIDGLLASGYSRFPVYRNSKDEIIGVLTLRDTFELYRKGKGHVRVADAADKPYFVPTAMVIGDLLRIFQRERNHIAIVIGEYGETAGVVTLEDVLEEIVGEIEDEADVERKLVVKLSERRFLVDASIPVEDLNRAVGLALPVEQHNTLNGLLTDIHQNIPRPGARLEVGGHCFVVRQADSRRVIRAELLLGPPKDGEGKHG